MSQKVQPRVEVVIPVHTPERPLRRAVESILADPAPVAVIVVAHGIDPSVLADHLAGLDMSRVLVLSHNDGIKSAAGPFNAGIAAATAEFVAVMGSDDWLEPGCVTALLAHADEGARPDAVLVPTKHQDGAEIPSPLPRPGRERNLDAAKDELFYRTAPLGLIRTATWRPNYEFDASLHAGIDMEPSARLWASGASISYARHAPRYVIGADAKSRVSMDPVAVRKVMGAIYSTAGAPWTREATPAVRRSLAIKLARVHILGFVYARACSEKPLFSPDDVAALQEATVALTALSPRWREPFSVADRWIFEVVEAAAGAPEIVAVAQRRAGANLWQRQVPRKPWKILDRESNLVRTLRMILDRRAMAQRIAAKR